MTESRIVVVLGMHRSGTSAVSAMLQALGVDLGDRLMPPAGNQNPKGFFEDWDIVELNREMLSGLGSDWWRLAPVDADSVARLNARGFRERARALLERKQRGKPIFGFKDPRTAKLLPFWQAVLDDMPTRVDYVLAVRHPRSVVDSLKARDQLDSHRGYLLWLAHVLTFLPLAFLDRSALLDYDTLLANPGEAMRRLGAKLDLAVDVARLDQLTQEFVDLDLRHTHYGVSDLQSDRTCPNLVLSTYGTLQDMLSSPSLASDHALQSRLKTSWKAFNAMSPTLQLIDDISQRRDDALKRLDSIQPAGPSEPRHYLQVFFDRGHGLSEADSVIFEVDVFADRVNPRIEFEPDPGLIGVRVDPINSAAVVTVHQVSLVTSAGEVDLLPQATSNADRLVDSRFHFSTHDPHIAFTFEPENVGRGVGLQVSLAFDAIGPAAVARREAVESQLAEQLARREQGWTDSRIEAQANLRDLEQQVAAAHRSALDAKARHADLEGEVKSLKVQLRQVGIDHAEQSLANEREFGVQLTKLKQELLEREITWNIASASLKDDFDKQRHELLSQISALQRDKDAVHQARLEAVEAHARREMEMTRLHTDMTRQAAREHRERERALQQALLEAQRALHQSELRLSSQRNEAQTTLAHALSVAKAQHDRLLSATESEGQRRLSELGTVHDGQLLEWQSRMAKVDEERLAALSALGALNQSLHAVRQQLTNTQKSAAENLALTQKIAAENLALKQREVDALQGAVADCRRALEQQHLLAAQAEQAWHSHADAWRAQLQSITTSPTWRLGLRARILLPWTAETPPAQWPAPPLLQWQGAHASPFSSTTDPRPAYSTESSLGSSFMPDIAYTSYQLKVALPRTVDDLLDLHDEAFVHAAYQTILGRAPDEEGLKYYLRRVRQGIPKVETLAQLRLSREGAQCAPRISGLDEAIRRFRSGPMRTFHRLFGRVSSADRQAAALQNQLYVASLSQAQRFDRVDQTLAALSVQMAHLAPSAGGTSVTRPPAQGPGTPTPADVDRSASGTAGEVLFSTASMRRDCVLRPINELVVDAEDSLSWMSLGADPHFDLRFVDPSTPQVGWNRVDLRIEGSRRHGEAKFYLDMGSGFNETDVVIVPYLDDQLVSRWFYVERPVSAIRFDPCEGEGRFRIEHLAVEAGDQAEAASAMLDRLSERHPAYQGQQSAVIMESITASSNAAGSPVTQALMDAYGATFSTLRTLDYQEWIYAVEEPSMPRRYTVEAAFARMANAPLISVVIPVYDTPEVFLRACIDSVRAQSYPRWELCIADDASSQPHVRKTLREYADLDPRIKVVFRLTNGHISEASNSALELAKGDFVALVDHDDTLPEHALHFVATAVASKPDVAIIYTDEDKIDVTGKRFEPHFKSDWNPDLFFTQNYVSHLGVYRRELLTKINGFRAGVEGSQDHDLLLRCLPHVEHSQIVHIPRVLYHWRAIAGSTAVAAGEKTYTSTAALRALGDYFSKNGPEGVAVTAAAVPNTYRVRFPLPRPAPLVSLLIPTRDRLELVETCVRSIIEKSTYANYEIVILDNGSTGQETLSFFRLIERQEPRVRVIRYDKPFNFSAINNFGVANSKGAIIGLINNDVEVISPEWLTEMVSQASRPEIGCVGAKLYYDNDTIQHAGVICGLNGVAGHSHKHFPRHHPGYFGRLLVTQNLSAVTAACLLIRREVYDEVQGLDEDNLPIAFNDVDLCLKVQAKGYRNLLTPYAELYHHESISRGAEDTPEKRKRFESEIDFMKRKWTSQLASDPYYNPNLTTVREDFSIGL